MRLSTLLLTAGLFSAGLGFPAARAQTLNEFYASQPGNHSSAGFASTAARTDTVVDPNGTTRLIMYFASGQKKLETPYSDFQQGKIQGTQTRWFESGQVQAVEEFAQNQRHGRLLTYYPDGRPRRQEQYEAGRQLRAACFGPDGQPRKCPPYLLFPEYPGGLMVLLTTIRDRTNYPRKLIQQGVSGKVKIDFVIDKTGAVQNARVTEGVNPELDAEALRVVNSLRGWVPGRLDGEPVDVEFSLPVTFAIR